MGHAAQFDQRADGCRTMSVVPVIKGYCPGALTPMASGDGIVVRVRPFKGRLRRAQADGIATLAAAHGNGLLDLSSRANIQIRGVTQQSYPALIEGLGRMELLDATPQIEARRNIIIAPFWQTADETAMLASQLTEAMASHNAPNVPHKFGFAIDTGMLPVLQTASADVRVERDAGGGLILVADGMETGKPVTSETVIQEALALARWFLDTRQTEKRMAALIISDVDQPSGYIVPRLRQSYQPAPGYTPNGAMVGFAFGQLHVETLAALAKHGALRMTPWRMLLVESARLLPDIDGLIADPDDPLLRVVACSGTPACAQGHVETRALGQNLAAHLPKDAILHVSGCAKGCAHPKATPLCVTGTPHGLDLIRDGRPGDTPIQTGLSAQDIIKAI